MMARINLQLFAGEKTEPATPRRREEARKKGQVAKSGELGVAVMVLVGFLTISALRPFWMDRIQSLVRHFLSTAHEWDGSISALQGIFLTALYQAGPVLVPVLVRCLCLPLHPKRCRWGSCSQASQSCRSSPASIPLKGLGVSSRSELSSSSSSRSSRSLLWLTWCTGSCGAP